MRSISIAIGTVLMAVSAAAQTAGTPRDHAAAWFGCWLPAETQAPIREVRVCVVPTSQAGALRLITFAGDEQIREETIEADGVKHPMEEDRCTGDRVSRWSASGARLFVSAELRCDGKAAQPSSMLSTLVTPNRWLEIQAVGPAGREAVRTRRYNRATDPPPAEIADILRGVSVIPSAIAKTTIDDVVEATKAVSSPVAELWLADTEPRLVLNRQGLVRLSNGGVPEPVIDLLVGLAYPKHFEVRSDTRGSLGFGGFGNFDMPWTSASWGPWDYGWSPYAMMYAPFAVPWGFGYGYNDYYGGLPYGFVTPRGGGEGGVVPSGRGQVVNGQGYTRVQPAGTAVESGSASSSSSGSTGGGDAGFASSGGGSVSPGGYSSGGGGGGGGGGAVAVAR